MRRKPRSLEQVRREALNALVPLIHYSASVWTTLDKPVSVELRRLADRMAALGKKDSSPRTLEEFWDWGA